MTTPAPDFSAIPDVDLGEEKRVEAKVVSTGIILFDEGDKIWIFEPRNHFGGYQHTFPKGRVEDGLTYQQNAHKEVLEETGLLGMITGLVGDFVGDVTTTRYYTGVRTGGKPTCGPETQAVKLVSLADAEPLLNKPKDKKVLRALKDLLRTQRSDGSPVLAGKATGDDCPACGSDRTAPVAIGFPSPEMEEEARRGEIILGGDVLTPERLENDRGCLACGHRWASRRPGGEPVEGRRSEE